MDYQLPQGDLRVCPTSPVHRYRSNGQIEVDGEGVIPAEFGGYHADGDIIQSVWDQWGESVIRPAAEEFGVPVTFLLAEMIIESRGKNVTTKVAGAGGLFGMQNQAFRSLLGRYATDEEMMDPLTNARGAAALMATNAKTYGLDLPALVAAHNAGSVKCASSSRCHSLATGTWDLDGTSAPTSWGTVEDCTNGRTSAYVRRAVGIHNSAIEMGIGGSSIAGVGAGLVLFVAAAAVAWYLSREFSIPQKISGLFD